MNIRRFALIAPLVLLAAACEEPWSDESDLDLTPGFLLPDDESGEYTFQPLADRDSIVMERGFQGGQHIQPTLLTDAFEDFAEVDYRIEILMPATGSEEVFELDRGQTGAWPAEDIGEDPALTYLNPRVVLRDQGLVGEEIVMRIQITGPDGQIGRVKLQGVVELFDPFADPGFDGAVPR